MRSGGGGVMRAYGFTALGGPSCEAWLDVPEPTPGEGELLVRVRAAGVNPGDWRLREGSYGPVAPAVLGREVAGQLRLPRNIEFIGFEVGQDLARPFDHMLGQPGQARHLDPIGLARRPFDQLAQEYDLALLLLDRHLEVTHPRQQPGELSHLVVVGGKDRLAGMAGIIVEVLGDRPGE